MMPIPDPPVAPPSYDPARDRVRFRFRVLMRATGACSRKEFRDLPLKDRRTICRRFRYFGRMTVHQFRVSDAKPRRRKFKMFRPPHKLSPDIADQAWFYFNLTNRIRVVGVFLDRDFLVHAIAPDHDMK